MNRSSDEERRARIRQHAQGKPDPAETGSGELLSPAPQDAAKPIRGYGRTWLILLACLLGSLGVSFVVFKFFILASVPSELVGAWQVIDGPLRGATLEFRQDGAVVATVTKMGKKEITNSSAKVDGQKLYLTTKDSETGKEDTVLQTILNLTEDELVLRDEDKRTYRMKRVRN